MVKYPNHILGILHLFQDGGIIKRVITAGEGYDTPNDGSQVTVTLKGRDRYFLHPREKKNQKIKA
jgi:hypothetical protein